jgi:uncharacterized secreted protein with C-terminal beta-propeller domain
MDVAAAQPADDAFEVRQNSLAQPLDVLANDVFGDGYAGERQITSASYGSQGGRIDVAADGRTLWYAPPADYSGTETFVYYVDNQLSAEVEVTISAPLAADKYKLPPDGQAKTLDVLANDPLWAGYDGLGERLAVAGDGKSLIYTPAPDSYGTDDLVYVVDGLYPARVKIEIPDPLEYDRYRWVVQNSEGNALDVLANDPFWPGYTGNRVITHVVGGKGTATIGDDGRRLLYAPAPDFEGWDEFRYVVDGLYEAKVQIQVHRPIQDDWFEVDVESTDYLMRLTANDYYELPGSSRIDVVDRVTWAGETAHGGTVEITDDGQGVLYSAPEGFIGTDTFEYVADGEYRATVTVDVTRPVRDDFFFSRVLWETPVYLYNGFSNRVPTNPARGGVYEDTVDNVLDVTWNDFLGNGYRGPRVITSVGETSEGGIVRIAPGGQRLMYTPPSGFRGVDRFTYTVDGELEAQVSVEVGRIIAADYFRFDADFTKTGYDLDVLLNDHFVGTYPGWGVITSVGEISTGGSVTVSPHGQYLHYVPGLGGAERFTYTVDGKYEASVYVHVAGYLAPDSFVVDQNSAGHELSPLKNDFHYGSWHRRPYNGPGQITSVGDCEQGGTVTIAADGTLVYSPAPDFYGTDRFTYTVDDLMTTTVTVHVIRRVRDDVFRVEADSNANPLAVLVNDLFGANYTGPGRITGVTDTAAGGTAAISDDGASILYTPPAGFTGADDFTYTVDGALKAEVTVWVDTSVDQMLPQFDSAADLEQFLLDDALERYEPLFGQVYQPRYWAIGELDSVYVASEAATGAYVERIHSETNVQVAGVDEADLIETDGDYLYILSGGELIIARAWPAEEMSIASRAPVEGTPIGEYLHGDRLTIVSQTWESPPRPTIDRWYYRPLDQKTWVTVYDVSDRESPTILEKTELDGRYVESRRIDDSVFLVLRDDRVDRWLPEPIAKPTEGDGAIMRSNDRFVPEPPMAYVYESREEYIERVTADMESFLPHYTSYGADGEVLESGLLHPPEDVYRPLSDDAGSLVSVVSIDMSDDARGIKASTGIFTGGASKIYGSLDHLYVFDQQYTPEDRVVTRILEFDWDAESGNVELAARGQVAGRLLNQFSADEHDGYLRIATTINHRHSGNWSGSTENVLFVLRDDGGVLEFVGGMQNLALGETIRSVRFLGDRAFVTTFRTVDPLFALDLSDPARPRALGHVTMPGYNSYMQLIDEHHVLTVGRNTVDGRSGPAQVSLFDVADLSRPRLIEQYTFERFSRSEAEADHHAFGWFAEHHALAMPSARVYWERVDADGDGYRETRSQVHENELFLFRIDVAATRQSGEGIQLLGMVEHEGSVRRSAFVDDVLYSVADDSVHAVSIADPNALLATIWLHGPPRDEAPAAHEDPQTADRDAALALAVEAVMWEWEYLASRATGGHIPDSTRVSDALAPAPVDEALRTPEGAAERPQLAAIPATGESHAPADAVVGSVIGQSADGRESDIDDGLAELPSMPLGEVVGEDGPVESEADREAILSRE